MPIPVRDGKALLKTGVDAYLKTIDFDIIRLRVKVFLLLNPKNLKTLRVFKRFQGPKSLRDLYYFWTFTQGSFSKA
jgi:hypothetical protein